MPVTRGKMHMNWTRFVPALHRFACQPKLQRYCTLALAFDSNCPSYPPIEFHLVHPSGVPRSPPLRQEPAKLRSGGLVLPRRLTPLPRRNAVYFCSGAYTRRGSKLLMVTVPFAGGSVVYLCIVALLKLTSVSSGSQMDHQGLLGFLCWVRDSASWPIILLSIAVWVAILGAGIWMSYRIARSQWQRDSVAGARSM